MSTVPQDRWQRPALPARWTDRRPQETGRRWFDTLRGTATQTDRQRREDLPTTAGRGTTQPPSERSMLAREVMPIGVRAGGEHRRSGRRSVRQLFCAGTQDRPISGGHCADARHDASRGIERSDRWLSLEHAPSPVRYRGGPALCPRRYERGVRVHGTAIAVDLARPVPARGTPECAWRRDKQPRHRWICACHLVGAASPPTLRVGGYVLAASASTA